MTLEALVFDVDGTLVDNEELHRRAFNQAFLEFQLGWDWTPEIYMDFLQISGGTDRIKHFVDALAVSDAEKTRLRSLIPGLHREKSRIYGELIAGAMVKPRPGVARLIREASDSGLKVGLAATSASKNVQPLVVSALGRDLASKISAVVSSDLVSRKKPAPDLYLLLLSMLGVAPERCIAFEDSANGVTAARDAGLVTIAVPGRWTLSQDFSRAHLRLSTLGDMDHPLPAQEALLLGGTKQVELQHISKWLDQFGTPPPRVMPQG